MVRDIDIDVEKITLPHDDMKDVHTEGEPTLSEVIEEKLLNMERGFIASGAQPGGGKSHTTLEFFAESVKHENEYSRRKDREEDDKADLLFMMFSGDQSLLKQHEENLKGKFGLNDKQVLRVKGFERISPLYPAEENSEGEQINYFSEISYNPDEGYKVIPKPEYEEEITERQKKVAIDKKLGIQNKYIIQKYLEEDEESKWSQQWDVKWNKANMVVLAPTDYLNKKCLGKARDNSNVVATDEKIDRSDEEKWDFDEEEMREFFDYIFDNHYDILSEVVEEVSKYDEAELTKNGLDDVEFTHIDFEDLEVSRIKEIVYGSWYSGFIDWCKDLDRNIKYHSAVFRMNFNKMNRRDAENESNGYFDRRVGDFNQWTDDKIRKNKGEVKLLRHIFKKVRTEIYKEADKPSEYRILFSKWPDFDKKLKFAKIMDYEHIRFQERIEEWGQHKQETKKFEEKKEETDEDVLTPFNGLDEDEEIGFYNGNSYRKKGDKVRFAKEQKAVYEENFIFKLFDLMDDTPVIALDARHKQTQIKRKLAQYGDYRARQLDVNWRHSIGSFQKKHSWDKVKSWMTDVDKLVHNGMDGRYPYVPSHELRQYEGEKLEYESINFVLINTSVTSDAVIERVKMKYTGKDKAARFRKRGKHIQSMEDGEIPKFLELMIKYQDYSLISFQDAVKGVREQLDEVGEDNSSWYHGLEGSNKMKGDNLVLVGTPMTNLDAFRREAEAEGFSRQKILDPTKQENGRYVYEDDKYLQEFYEQKSSDVAYQAAHRSRFLLEHEYDYKEDKKLTICGIIPEDLKEEVGEIVEVTNEDKIKEIVIQENGGVEELVEQFKEQGKLYVDDVKIGEDIDHHILVDVLREVEEAYDKNLVIDDDGDEVFLRKDNWRRDKTNYEILKDLVQNHSKELNMTEFREWVIESSEITGTHEISKQTVERLKEENLVELTEQNQFPYKKKIRF